jgi:uncharacterized membrane protein
LSAVFRCSFAFPYATSPLHSSWGIGGLHHEAVDEGDVKMTTTTQNDRLERIAERAAAAAAGSVIGAVVGSILLPGIGTAIGAKIGAAAGGSDLS